MAQETQFRPCRWKPKRVRRGIAYRDLFEIARKIYGAPQDATGHKAKEIRKWLGKLESNSASMTLGSKTSYQKTGPGVATTASLNFARGPVGRLYRRIRSCSEVFCAVRQTKRVIRYASWCIHAERTDWRCRSSGFKV
jgi:hypothetical protein